MKWNSNEPITPGYYLCAAVGYNRPIMLCWRLTARSFLPVRSDGVGTGQRQQKGIINETGDYGRMIW